MQKSNIKMTNHKRLLQKYKKVVIPACPPLIACGGKLKRESGVLFLNKGGYIAERDVESKDSQGNCYRGEPVL
jgi:hypothetical protein